MRITKMGSNEIITAANGRTEIVSSANVVKWLNPAEGAEPLTLDLSLDRGRTAAVQIRDADGQPLSGAIVSGMTATWPMTFALKQPDCTLYGLNPKTPRTVVFYHPERKLGAVLTVRGDEDQPLTARLAPMGEVEGRVVDAAGQPVASARVIVVYWANSARELDRYLQPQQTQVQTDADGRFRVQGVTTSVTFDLGFGKGSVHLATLEGKPWFSPNQVKSGQTLDLGELRTKPFRP
jgi:hypothetical protein